LGEDGGHRPLALPQEIFLVPKQELSLVPKLLLGNGFWPKLCLGTFNSDRIIFPLNYFAKWTFATKGVPKQELGNQRRGQGVSLPGPPPNNSPSAWEPKKVNDDPGSPRGGLFLGAITSLPFSPSWEWR